MNFFIYVKMNDGVYVIENNLEIFDEYININDEDMKNYKNILRNEINKLVLENWIFLNDNWSVIKHKYKHRTEIKHIKFIDEVKKILLDKLGYISIFFFLTVLYTHKEYPAPYFEVEKGLMLIYHLVSGITSKNINRYIPYTSFYSVYKKFWITNYSSLNKLVDYFLLNMFSNVKIRILSAKIKNPKNFKNITLLLDGHDTSIDYSKPDISIQKKWSYKLKRSGIRTQVVADINEMAIFISKSELCGNSSDGGMFLNMKLYNKIDKRDVIAIDGGYTLFVKQFEELCNEKGIELGDNNFFYPIRKDSNSELNMQENHFNNVFGSFRSMIENQFCELHNKFTRFSNNNSTLKADDIKYITLQLKVSFLLKNIQKFSEKFNIITQDHHKLWMNNGFEFPSEDKIIDIVLNDQIKQMEKIKIMSDLQNDLEFLNIGNINMEIDKSDSDKNNNDESDIDFPEYKNITKKRKRNKKKKQNVDINNVRDIEKDDNYEVEDIIKHRIENNKYVFLVKWIGFSSKDNSWVREEDFNSKEIIKDYFNKNHIIYNN